MNAADLAPEERNANPDRVMAAGAILDRIGRMQSECETPCKVVEDLRVSAVKFERLLGESGV